MLNWDEETKKARTAFIDHEKIDPKINWRDFLRDWKMRAAGREQGELKAKLSYKHKWTTPDTIEGRCLIWQRQAFRRE